MPPSARGVGSIPGWGAKIPHALWPKNQNIKLKQYCNKFNKDFQNGHIRKKILKKNRQGESKKKFQLTVSILEIVIKKMGNKQCSKRYAFLDWKIGSPTKFQAEFFFNPHLDLLW